MDQTSRFRLAPVRRIGACWDRLGNCSLRFNSRALQRGHEPIIQGIERLRDHYGARLHDIVLFGSRARGDQHPDSDVDLAVILADDDWNFWVEKLAVADLSYEALVDGDIEVHGWPLSLAAWRSPDEHRQRRLIEAIKRDGRHWQGAA